MKVKVEGLLKEIKNMNVNEEFDFFSRHYGVETCENNLKYLKSTLEKVKRIKTLKRYLAKAGVHFQYVNSMYSYGIRVSFRKDKYVCTVNSKRLKDIIIELKKLIKKQEKEIEVLEKEIDIEIK